MKIQIVSEGKKINLLIPLSLLKSKLIRRLISKNITRKKTQKVPSNDNNLQNTAKSTNTLTVNNDDECNINNTLSHNASTEIEYGNSQESLSNNVINNNTCYKVECDNNSEQTFIKNETISIDYENSDEEDNSIDVSNTNKVEFAYQLLSDDKLFKEIYRQLKKWKKLVLLEVSQPNGDSVKIIL